VWPTWPASAAPTSARWATRRSPPERGLGQDRAAEHQAKLQADETDGESLRACEQTTEALLAYEVGGTAVEPSLATACTPNEDLTVWTCTLREGVTFHDGSTLDTGAFSYFSALWGGFLNAPPAEG